MHEDNFVKVGIKVSIVTIIANTVLSVLKLVSGIIGKSNAMISDSIHSFSDVFSTIIVIIGLRYSNMKADKKHPYGHERFETVAAIILATILLFVGLFMGIKGIENIFTSNVKLVIPTKIALIAAIISIVVKEWMYWYTIYYAKKINSGSLKADAWHHRSDALSSIGSLIGILGAMMGYPVLDSVASIIICLFIIKVAVDIYKDSLNKMVDCSCDAKTIEKINDLVLGVKDVKTVDLLKTRLFGNKIYIDLEIGVNKRMSLKKAHDIAHNVHDRIEEEIKDVKHCNVHVNPK